MNTTDTTQDTALLQPREKPKTEMLIEMMTSAVNANTGAIDRMMNAKYIRDCQWPGKDGTGTKGRDENNRLRGPWENSSDVAVKLADGIIIEHSLLLMLAVLRSNVTATPQEMEDEGAAALAVGLLGYYFNGQMNREVWSVMGRAIDCMLSYGHALIRVGWKQSFRMVEKEITYATLVDWAAMQEKRDYAEQLAAMVGDAPLNEGEVQAIADEIEAAGEAAGTEMTAVLTDRTARPQLIALLEAFDDTMCEGEPARLATALQNAKAGTFRYYATEVTENRPQWRMLQPWVDVFYLGLAEDLQEEPFISEVEWVTKMQFLELAAVENWDAEWTKKVLEKPGRSFGINISQGADWILNGADVNQVIPWQERETNYWMLTRITYKAVNNAGTIGVWETLVHDACPERAAYHRLSRVADGEYPYVEIPRGLKRRLVDNTGIPEEVEPEQAQLKSMADARQDKTALDVKPPVKVHWKDIKRGVRAQIYPGAEFAEREGVSTSFMQVGNMGAQQLSLQDETQLRIQVARRFGLIHPEVPAAVTQAHMEFMAGHLFKYLKVLTGKTFGLLQQHMDPLTGIRIAGGPEIFAAAGGDKVLNVSREEIQGRYDFNITFDPRNLNMEWVLERIKAITEMVIPIDNMAAVDRAAILRMALSSIDPRLAAYVKTQQGAAQDEMLDEMSAWTAIVSGAEPPMREGVDYATRYAFWRDLLQRSPRAAQLLQSDEQVHAVTKNRLKYLKQGLTQEQNKITGRIGTSEVLSPAAESLLGE